MKLDGEQMKEVTAFNIQINYDYSLVMDLACVLDGDNQDVRFRCTQDAPQEAVAGCVDIAIGLLEQLKEKLSEDA